MGDLKEVDALLKEYEPNLCQQEGSFAVDALLSQILPCPFAIAWDGEKTTPGDKTPTPSFYDGTIPAECLQGNRCFILGGGVAPHRRQPETFSWTLTRFVEDKVAPSIPMANKRKVLALGTSSQVGNKGTRGSRGGMKLPKWLTKVINRDYFSSGSLVVYGRIIATALLYASMLKVGIHQYATFLDGMVNMKTRYDILQSLRRKVAGMISGFFLNYGYIPLIFRKDTALQQADVLVKDLNMERGNATDVATVEETDIQKGEHTETSDHQAEGMDDEKPGTSDDGSEPLEDASDEAEPEEEEQSRFQPLFFLDRVVA